MQHGSVDTNIGLLQAILQHPDYLADDVDTRFVEARMAALAAPAQVHPRRFFAPGPEADLDVPVDDVPAGSRPVLSPMGGLVVAIQVAVGDVVEAGQTVAILEAMKLELAVTAAVGGVVSQLAVLPGVLVGRDRPLLFVVPSRDALESGAPVAATAVDLDLIRPDLAASIESHRVTLDAARPAAVARRRKTGQMTAREGLAALCDLGSFREYGALVVAGQRQRRSLDELISVSPADGIVAGVGTVNGATAIAAEHCVILAYDYTVFAGTQGWMGHAKMDRGVVRLAGLIQGWQTDQHDDFQPIPGLSIPGRGHPARSVAVSLLQPQSAGCRDHPRRPRHCG